MSNERIQAKLVAKPVWAREPQIRTKARRAKPDITASRCGGARLLREAFKGRQACYFGIMIGCLEKPWLPDQQDRDYLGLEIGIYLWLDTDELEIDMGFNTSSI